LSASRHQAPTTSLLGSVSPYQKKIQVNIRPAASYGQLTAALVPPQSWLEFLS
jgi:hypothetical protein